MIKKWNITIPELTGDEERRLYVYLPRSYQKKRQKRKRNIRKERRNL